MRKFITILLVLLSIMIVSCESVAENTTLENSKSELPVESVKFSAHFMNPETLDRVVGFCDYLVLCEVKERKDSYLYDGKLDTTLSEKEIKDQLMGIRTPYEIVVLDVYKGDLKIGDSLTICAAHGIIPTDNLIYEVDFGLPVPEVGKTYIIPICSVYGTDEYAATTSAMVEVVINENQIYSTNSIATAEIIPLMFDDPYKEISNINEFANAVNNIITSVPKVEVTE